MLKPGDPAPDFTLTDEQGKKVTLSSYRGKSPVVLIFYPADQTAVCTAQLCEVRDSYRDFTAAGAVVFGINNADAGSHRKFAERHKFPFRLLVDRDKRVSKLYDCVLGWGILSLINRTVVVVGKDGRVLYAQRGKPSPREVLGALGGRR